MGNKSSLVVSEIQLYIRKDEIRETFLRLCSQNLDHNYNKTYFPNITPNYNKITENLLTGIYNKQCCLISNPILYIHLDKLIEDNKIKLNEAYIVDINK